MLFIYYFITYMSYLSNFNFCRNKNRGMEWNTLKNKYQLIKNDLKEIQNLQNIS